MSDPSGGDLLVDLLRHLGIDAAFGVVSVHNLPLVEAIDRSLRWVPTRGEAGAVGAADGYGRAKGTIGCAVTSTGTGAGNAAGALVEALTAGAPLLHVTGQIDAAHLGQGRGVIHETKDQLAMLAAVSTWAATVGDDAAGTLAAAASAALATPGGPASIEWPIDLQYAPPPARYGWPRSADGGLRGKVGAASPAADLERAVELLASAERPIVWAGGGAVSAGAPLGRLLDRLGTGLLTSNAGRGALPESDERVIGNFGAAPAGAELLAEADVLLSIGTHFRSNETRSYRLALPETHIQIDADPAALGRAYPVTVGLVGDATATLTFLADELEAERGSRTSTGADPEWTAVVRAARPAAEAQLRRDIGPYAHLCDAMAAGLGPTGHRVRDITIPNSAWGNRILGVEHPTTNLYPRGGGIGQALALGIGAAVANPDVPTMVLIGDGGLQLQLGELATLAEEQLPVTVVVFDDGGYGVIRNTQDAHLDRRFGVDLVTPDFAAVAAAFDLPYASVGTPAEFASAFHAAVNRAGPSLVRVECARLGPMPKPFTPPVDVPGSAR